MLFSLFVVDAYLPKRFNCKKLTVTGGFSFKKWIKEKPKTWVSGFKKISNVFNEFMTMFEYWYYES
ncbi:MAG TPA: hypothetical protein DIT07_05355 [Sphingobacteriaceae bacterium]|nr:hypothetical protein [Sphingobacteriaceae bacterium]